MSDDLYQDLPTCCCKGMEENEQLKARIARLEGAIRDMLIGDDGQAWKEAERTLNQSPCQSLDHIRREAMEEMRDTVSREAKNLGGYISVPVINEMTLPIDKEEG